MQGPGLRFCQSDEWQISLEEALRERESRPQNPEFHDGCSVQILCLWKIPTSKWFGGMCCMCEVLLPMGAGTFLLWLCYNLVAVVKHLTAIHIFINHVHRKREEEHEEKNWYFHCNISWQLEKLHLMEPAADWFIPKPYTQHRGGGPRAPTAASWRGAPTAARWRGAPTAASWRGRGPHRYAITPGPKV